MFAHFDWIFYLALNIPILTAPPFPLFLVRVITRTFKINKSIEQSNLIISLNQSINQKIKNSRLVILVKKIQESEQPCFKNFSSQFSYDFQKNPSGCKVQLWIWTLACLWIWALACNALHQKSLKIMSTHPFLDF